MLAKKYITEDYYDRIHYFGYFRTENYYFAEPHNVIVSISVHGVDVKSALEPQTFYYLGRLRKDTCIYEVTVPMDFLTECMNLFALIKLKEESTKKIISYKIESNYDLYYSCMQMGKDAFINDSDKTNAVMHYDRALTYKPNDMDALYNLSCCYANSNVSTSIYYLKRAINAGFVDVSHLIYDPDLINLKYESEFKSIVEDLKEFNSAKECLSIKPHTDEDIEQALHHLNNAVKSSLFQSSFIKSYYAFQCLHNNELFNQIIT